VIETSDLIDDLTNWSWLYAAGRMQKPTVAVGGVSGGGGGGGGLDASDAVEEAQRTNLRMALAASLLLLGRSEGNRTACLAGDDDGGGDAYERYELTHLYETIAGLSYGGDPRMAVNQPDE